MVKRYYVYILGNEAVTCLYIGVTNDLRGRTNQHGSGLGRGFTARYRISKLLYFEEYPDPRQAIAREKQLKSWRREKKDALIRTMNPELYDLRPQLWT